MFKGIDIPDLTAMNKIEINMSSNSDYKMSDDLVELMKSSDVTTITSNAQTLAEYMFAEMTPNVIKNIEDGLDSGIKGMNSAISDMDKNIEKLNATIVAMSAMPGGNPNQAKLVAGLEGIKAAKSGLNDTITKMETLKGAVPGAFETAKENYINEIKDKQNVIENEFQNTLNGGFSQVYATVAISVAFAFILLMFYKDSAKQEN